MFDTAPNPVSFMNQPKPYNARGCVKLAQAVLQRYLDDMAPADTTNEILEFYCSLSAVDFTAFKHKCNSIY